jgi:hypothetical protein
VPTGAVSARLPQRAASIADVDVVAVVPRHPFDLVRGLVLRERVAAFGSTFEPACPPVDEPHPLLEYDRVATVRVAEFGLFR